MDFNWKTYSTESGVRTIFLLVIWAVSTAVFSQSLKTQEYRLSNGLKIIVREDHRAPVVLSSIWYKVGGSYESNGTTGISHVLEHMMFKGTKKYGPGELNRLISENGGSQNAMTSEDFTMYYQELPADQLALSFQLEADRMNGLLLSPDAFIKEMQVVMEERRMRVDNNPQGKAWEFFRAAAFINNPYHHPVVGWMTDLKHMTVQDVSAWYHRWYAPNNAVLVVIGDVDSNHVFQLAQKYFLPVKSSSIEKLKPRTEVPSPGKRTVSIHTRAATPILMMGFNVPTLASNSDRDKKEIYALKLASFILDSGESARLQRELVRKRNIAVSASAHYDLYNLHQTQFTLIGIPAPRHSLHELEKAFLSQVQRLKTKPVGHKELARVKAQLLAYDTYKKDSLMTASLNIGVPEMVGLSWRDADEFTQKILAIKPEEIQAAVKKYLTVKRLTIANLVPTAKSKRK